MVLRLRVIELDNETCKWKWGSAVSDNIMTVHKEERTLGHFNVQTFNDAFTISIEILTLYFIIAAFEADLNIQAPRSRKIILDRYNRQFVGKMDAILFCLCQ